MARAIASLISGLLKLVLHMSIDGKQGRRNVKKRNDLF